MNILQHFALILISIAIVSGQYYMSSPVFAGGFSPFQQQFGGFQAGGFSPFQQQFGGWQAGGFSTAGYPGFSSFNQGYYDEPTTHVHYHQRSGGFGNILGDISQRDILAGKYKMH